MKSTKFKVAIDIYDKNILEDRIIFSNMFSGTNQSIYYNFLR
jgi:hypothetical protein